MRGESTHNFLSKICTTRVMESKIDTFCTCRLNKNLRGAPPMLPQDKALRDYWPFVSGCPHAPAGPLFVPCCAVQAAGGKENQVFFWGGKFQERRRELFLYSIVITGIKIWYSFVCECVVLYIYFKFQSDFWTVNHEALDICTQKCLQEKGWCFSYVFHPFDEVCSILAKFLCALSGCVKVSWLTILYSPIPCIWGILNMQPWGRHEKSRWIYYSYQKVHKLQTPPAKKTVSSNSWIDAFHSCADGRHWFYL